MNSSLYSAENSQQFFILAMDALATKRKKKLSYSEIARKAGFSSRSYPREIFTGRRAITRDACLPLGKALELNAGERKYFSALVELDIAKREKNDTRIAIIEDRLEKYRLRGSQNREASLSEADLPRIHFWAEIYAALGEPEVGATIEEISQRVRRFPAHLAEAKLRPVLEELVRNGIATLGKNDRYIAKDFYLLFSKHKHHGIALSFFKLATKEMLKRSSKEFSSPSALYRAISVSVDSKRLPELCRKLQETVDRFIEDAEAPRGDRIANLVLSLD